MNRSKKTECRKVITVYDPERRQSVSFTCYTCGEDTASVARRVHDAIPTQWARTSLNSRRHKRR
jgi:PHP family Zn ribbon phosphoesterase